MCANKPVEICGVKGQINGWGGGQGAKSDMGVARTVEDESRLRDKGSKGSSCEQPREGRTRRTGQERFSQRTQSGEHGESQATCSHTQPTQAPPEAAVKQASRAEARATTHGPLGMGYAWVLTALTGEDGDPQWERHPSLQGPPRAELGTVSVSLFGCCYLLVSVTSS